MCLLTCLNAIPVIMNADPGTVIHIIGILSTPTSFSRYVCINWGVYWIMARTDDVTPRKVAHNWTCWGRAVLGPGMVVVAVMRYSVVIALSVLLTMSMVLMRDVRKDEQMPKRYSSAKNRKPPFRRLYLSRAELRAIGYLHILQSCRVVPDIQHKSISRIILKSKLK